MFPPIITRDTKGQVLRYEAQTLATIGLVEANLERMLADEPQLLLLEEAGVHYQNINIATQVTLASPGGRGLRPDILAVTDGGEVVVIEVKKHGNPELNGRHVVAQVIDYAATLSALAESAQTAIFGSNARETLVESLQAAFPSKKRPELLAKTIASRLEKGEITLIIACDRAPHGLGDFVDAAASQSALGFTLRVVEITPYTPEGQSEPVLWVPRSRIETEVIARTAVTITNHLGSDRVMVQVEMDSARQIQEAEQQRTTGDSGKARQTRSLAITESQIGMPAGTLANELREGCVRAQSEDWTDTVQRLAWPWDDVSPILDARKNGTPRWGRQGINVGSSSWKPGLFLGTLVYGKDHCVDLLDPEGGADLAVILDVGRKAGKEGLNGDSFMSQPELIALKERLKTSASRFQFIDASARPNRWHPIHLRLPLAQVWADVEDTPEARYLAWLACLREGAALILAGGELEAIRTRVLTEQGTTED
jgi:hypothetical protein